MAVVQGCPEAKEGKRRVVSVTTGDCRSLQEVGQLKVREL